MTPSNQQSRIVILDVIRGFALFGIMLVNAPSINSPSGIAVEMDSFAFQMTAWDALVSQFIDWFAAGKFYPIFSFLFGLGVMSFIENAEHKQLNPNKLFAMRMCVLFVFGLLHMSLVWWGDILLVYAVIGSCLILFYPLSKQALLLRVSLIFIALLFYYYYFALLYISETDDYDFDLQMLYQTGTFTEIFWLRLQDYYDIYFWGLSDFEYMLDWIVDTVFYVLHLLSIFLLGAWTYKQRLLHDIDVNWHIIKPAGIVCLSFGIVSNILVQQSDFFAIFLYPVSGLSLGLGYIFILILAYKKPVGQKTLTPLAYLGRMSLTNYILSNVMMTLLFYGYGLGLYGTMGAGSQLWITLTMFLSLMLFSYYWLQHFRFGPLEYIWRKLTYGYLLR